MRATIEEMKTRRRFPVFSKQVEGAFAWVDAAGRAYGLLREGPAPGYRLITVTLDLNNPQDEQALLEYRIWAEARK